MALFLVTLAAFGVSMLAMAIGAALFRMPPLRSGCHPEGGACDGCRRRCGRRRHYT